MTNITQFDAYAQRQFNKIFEVRTCLECGSRCKLDHADPHEEQMNLYQCTKCAAYFRRYDFERAK